MTGRWVDTGRAFWKGRRSAAALLPGLGPATGAEGGSRLRLARSLRRNGFVAVVALAVAVELGSAVNHAIAIVRTGYHDLGAPRYATRDADLDPFAYFLSTDALVLARQLIPRDATYTVVVGNDPPVSDATDIPVVFRFWLAPRRYTSAVADAQWVITYHQVSKALSLRYSRQFGLGPDANLLRVER